MITDNGKLQKLKLVAGQVSRFADSFVVGTSGIVLPTSATSLDFPWAVARITGAYVDRELDQVVYHGTLAPDLVGDVVEVGLISQSDDFIQTGLPNSVVYTFGPDEQWQSDNAFVITTNSSIGLNNYQLVNATVAQFLARLTNGLNASRYDTIKLRLISTDVTQIRLLLKNDETTYAYKDITLVNGVNLVSTTLSTFTTVGAFDARDVQEIRAVVNTIANATNSLEFDALTFSSQANGGLVARHVLATPQYKRAGASMEMEFAVAI